MSKAVVTNLGEHARRYRRLLDDLLTRRELAGGSLPQDEESDAVAVLESCWWAMTDEEQAQADLELGGHPAPENG